VLERFRSWEQPAIRWGRKTYESGSAWQPSDHNLGNAEYVRRSYYCRRRYRIDRTAESKSWQSGVSYSRGPFFRGAPDRCGSSHRSSSYLPDAVAIIVQWLKFPAVTKFLCCPSDVVLPRVKEVAAGVQLSLVMTPNVLAHFEYPALAPACAESLEYPVL
jgi:hypothetical protein